MTAPPMSKERNRAADRTSAPAAPTLRAIDGYGLDDTTRLYIVLTLFGHVRGAATGLESEQQAERDTGIDMEEWMRVHDTRFAPVIQSGRFPHLAKLDNNADVDFDLGTLFEFGLTRLLDGFAALIEGRQRGRTPGHAN